jgi:D-alanyl-D-alanine carboxypeptidase
MPESYSFRRDRAARAWFDHCVRSREGRRGARQLTTCLIAALAVAAAAWAAPAPSLARTVRPAAAGAPAVTAAGGALQGFYSGDLLWSKGLDVRRPIASITKVMTALVVLRAGNLGQEITVTPPRWATPAATTPAARAWQSATS